MLCKKCGHQVADGMRFCNKCGMSLANKPNPPVPSKTENKWLSYLPFILAVVGLFFLWEIDWIIGLLMNGVGIFIAFTNNKKEKSTLHIAGIVATAICTFISIILILEYIDYL